MAHASQPSSRRPIVRLGLVTAGVVVAAAIVTNLGSPPPSQELTVDQRIMIDKIESVLLHDSETFQYDRILDQYDGRGYVGPRGLLDGQR